MEITKNLRRVVKKLSIQCRHLFARTRKKLAMSQTTDPTIIYGIVCISFAKH